MTKQEYQKLLDLHDWFYHMSDSTKVWELGLRQDRALKELYKDNPTFKKMYEETRDSILNPQKENS